MKSVILGPASVILLLSLIFLMPACATFETSILTLEPKNVSLNISGDYNISKKTSMAMAVQTIYINSTDPVGNNASFTLISLNMEGNDTSQINSKEFLNFMETMMVSMFELMGAKEVNNITVKSSRGQNVSLITLAMPGTKDMPGEETTFAFWNLNDYIHVMMTSELDINASSGIVETLEIKN